MTGNQLKPYNGALHQTVQCSASQLLLLLAASAANKGDSAVSHC